MVVLINFTSHKNYECFEVIEISDSECAAHRKEHQQNYRPGELFPVIKQREQQQWTQPEQLYID